MGAYQCGSCFWGCGVVDPATQRDVRAILNETQSLVRDVHTYVKEKAPRLEVRISAGFFFSHPSAHIASQEAASDATRSVKTSVAAASERAGKAAESARDQATVRTLPPELCVMTAPGSHSAYSQRFRMQPTTCASMQAQLPIPRRSASLALLRRSATQRRSRDQEAFGGSDSSSTAVERSNQSRDFNSL